MTTKTIAVLFASFSISLAHVGAAKASKRPETVALKDSCSTYLKLKDQKTPSAQWNTEQSASVGFCKGFFRGYMWASAEQFTEPDEKGRVKQIKIPPTTTYDQAIRVFVAALEERPELLSEDAGVVISAAMQLTGLMTVNELPDQYPKRP